MKYTPQQERAITTRDVSVALAAGAGCGKTFVLTQRFVAELLENPSEETLAGLMAITFTDRAAREMRDRIREAIAQQLAQCAEEEAESWEAILRDLESARIQTVHSFCTATLRSHATELGMDPDFSVLDAPTASAILSQAVQDVLEQQLRAKQEHACELVLRFGLEGVQSSLRSFAHQRFRYRETASIAKDEESLAKFWLDHFQKDYLPQRLKHFAESEIVKQTRKLLCELPEMPGVMQERGAIILQLFDKLDQTGMLCSDHLLEISKNAKVQGAAKNKWSDEEFFAEVKDCYAELRKTIKKVIETMEFDEEGATQAAHFGMQYLNLSAIVIDEFQRQKAERDAVDFDDLILMMRDLLDENPAVSAHLQQTTQFLMLDEFQDTDPVQTQIVKAVCGDRLTTGGLFLVGDVKQSIYRFRRADPTVFQELRRQIPEAGRLSLTKNFRSQQEILDFVNFLFGPEMGDDYDALHAFDETQYPPAAKTEFLWSGDEQVASNSVDQNRKVEADWIAKRISQLLNDTTPCIREKNSKTGKIELRRVQPGDIVILFRAFSNLGVYEDALRKTGIEYYVVGGRAFFAQQEIFDFVNLCRFLDDDTDEVSLVGILRSPLFSWSDDCIMLMKRSYESLLNAILTEQLPSELPEHQQTPVLNARRILNQLLAMRAEVGIGQMLRFAVRETAYDASLLCEFLGERKVANLQKLIGIADQFDQTGLLGLAEFAERLLESISEEAKEELAATHPESGNVVRLMTVHQSKGLEFPVVIVADVNRKTTSNTDRAVLSPTLGPLISLPMIQGEKAENPAFGMYRFYENCADEQEAIRLFYVATTRAADYLILSSAWDPDTKIVSPWMKLLSQRFSLQTGLPKGDSLLGQSQNAGVERNRIPEIHVVTKKPEKISSVSQKQKLRLSDWMPCLEEAIAVTPPNIALPVAIDRSSQKRFSVSQIEATDEIIHPKTASRKGSASGKGISLPLAEAELLGDLLHLAIEKTNFEQPREPGQVIDQLSLLFDRKLSEELRQTAIKRFELFQRSAVFEELKNAKRVYPEAEFLLRFDSDLKQPAAVVIGTVDCLLQDAEEGWHLIDYKTGYLPEDAKQVMDKYGLQMTLYALAIKELISNFPKSIRIVQLAESPRVVELELTATRIEEFTKRIEAAIKHLRDPVEIP